MSSLKCLSNSPSTELSSFAKSIKTPRSSIDFSISEYPFTQYFMDETFLRNSSAPFGSFQKSGARVFASLSSNSILFLSMSKRPPQRSCTLLDLFQLFQINHFNSFFTNAKLTNYFVYNLQNFIVSKTPGEGKSYQFISAAFPLFIAL